MMRSQNYISGLDDSTVALVTNLVIGRRSERTPEILRRAANLIGATAAMYGETDTSITLWLRHKAILLESA